MKAEKLSDLRIRNNLTQRDLAKQLNIGNSTIAMYETGERTPSLKRAIKIAKFFNTTVEKIIFANDK
ncbi:helix-turn-helix transcriptional regulator [Clostridioides difficile]|uniref:helix-turn-helix transcriptional regulator n=1 Tax=Clostridioides difficile TaxID=1496 RepID=UPI000D1E0497|nr:helix-turn-helix transcriptional regulator [Clostridioides difficile]